MLKIKNCASCGLSFDRKDTHKNRHGMYVCRPCQAKGVTLSSPQKLAIFRKKLKQLEPKLWRALLLAGLVVFSLWMFFKILESAAS